MVLLFLVFLWKENVYDPVMPRNVSSCSQAYLSGSNTVCSYFQIKEKEKYGNDSKKIFLICLSFYV